LARALAAEPRVLLLDEPFGALDAKVRLELRQWLRRLHDQIHLTSIFVTHDQEDAFAVADKVVVMRQGKIEQVGPPVEVFEHPANAFVMDFLGHVNVFKGHLREGRTVLTGYMPQSVPNQFNAPGIVFVRPHELDVRIGEPEIGGLPGIVDHMHPSGASIRIFLRSPCGEASCCVELSVDRFQHNPIKVGAHVWISPKKGRVFEPEYSI
jgi:sulfate transport system ATP-binding protein